MFETWGLLKIPLAKFCERTFIENWAGISWGVPVGLRYIFVFEVWYLNGLVTEMIDRDRNLVERL